MKAVLDFGAEVEFLTQSELDDSLKSANQSLVSAWLRGVAYRRIPKLTGVAAGGTLTLGDGGNGGRQAGPRRGYAWSLIRLAVNGLGGGVTPDVINFYRNGTGSDPIWQVNGNSWAATFGRADLVLLGGETLVAAPAGTLTATGVISVTGDCWELPEEMLGKLA